VALLKYRIISGDNAYDDSLVQDADGFGHLQQTGKRDKFTRELDYLSGAFRFNKAVYTTEVRHTDRVFAFPDYYLAYFYDCSSTRRLAGFRYQSVTGDPGHRSYFPLEAVSWQRDVGDLASVVLQNRGDFLQMYIFNFSERASHWIRTKMLQAGRYSLEVKDPATSDVSRSEKFIQGSGSRVELQLFPGREQIVSLSLI
jgi:hypothetical protein